MRLVNSLNTYFANLTNGRLILWSYFFLYLVVVSRHFQPTLSLWLTALGLSALIGTALLINTTRSGTQKVKIERWPLIRLYLFPFCVSSFSALVKGKVFEIQWMELATAGALSLAMWGGSCFAKHRRRLREADAAVGAG